MKTLEKTAFEKGVEQARMINTAKAKIEAEKAKEVWRYLNKEIGLVWIDI